MTSRSVVATAAAILLFSGINAKAQSANRQIGTQFTVTADPLVPRPHTKSCVVPLFTNFDFSHFSETTQTFQFTPPANCAGPWNRVVLDVDFHESAGIEFDRTANIWLANTNIYFGTTPEPLLTQPNSWHVERDVTDYGALFSTAQPGSVVLQNCTTECGFSGFITGSAKLEFYPTPGNSPGPRTADVVIPLVQSNGSGGVNLPAFLIPPDDQLSTTLVLPTNIEEAYLDVVSQSQQIDEQWYACLPNDLNSINDLFGCGTTDFRETEVTIDGQLAGIAPVSAWVFAGFLPDQWQPIPAAQTLDFIPYRVNLTPFASLLSDGNPHTITVDVFNHNFYFAESSSLLLFLDHGSAQVTGALTQNTLTAPSPAVVENLTPITLSPVTGTVGVTSDRSFTIAGYVNTSHGKVTTTISQHQKFSSNQALDFDTANFTVFDQNASVSNSVISSTKVQSNEGVKLTEEKFSFPITVDVLFPVNNSPFGLTVATTQKYQSSKLVLQNGSLVAFSSVTNSVKANDAIPTGSSQEYSSFDLTAPPYDCKVVSTQSDPNTVGSPNVLTSVSKGCKH